MLSSKLHVALLMLCLSQDCEFTYLSTQVLHLLGMEGPRTKEPAKYIRYIYNRVILENATVRAAAVSSLAQFGALVEELRPRVQVLLKRALHDNDDEVCLSAFALAAASPCSRPNLQQAICKRAVHEIQRHFQFISQRNS